MQLAESRNGHAKINRKNNSKATPQASICLSHPEGRTEAANAARFALRFKDRVRYCTSWKKWLVWDGQRWAVDEGTRVESLAKLVANDLWLEFAEAQGHPRLRGGLEEACRFCRASNSAKGISGLLQLARSEPGIGIDHKKLDVDPWLLNVANGTLDLRTGALSGHDPANLITKVISVTFNREAASRTWERFVEDVMGGDRLLADFIQQLLGYCLTGAVSEQVLPIFHGDGSNGKSTMLGTMMDLLGPDYSMKASQDLLLSSHSSRHPTELADLHGKRLVAAIETKEGAQLNESLVKELTGGDRIRARRMKEDFWEFSPTHKIILATNPKPMVRGTDHAIWRRLVLVPFSVTISDDRKDARLGEKLREELPGILNWALRGCLDWQQKRRLTFPNSVRSASEGYRREQDVVGRFLEERCKRASGATAGATELYEAFRRWCEHAGESAEDTIKQRNFGANLTRRGFERFTNNGTRYRGLELLTEGTEGTEPNSGLAPYTRA